tara:strand:+ start:694 stop:828 length:135 start_codon:yes stop_codon:yes gene_type:complete
MYIENQQTNNQQTNKPIKPLINNTFYNNKFNTLEINPFLIYITI